MSHDSFNHDAFGASSHLIASDDEIQKVWTELSLYPFALLIFKADTGGPLKFMPCPLIVPMDLSFDD